jgi:hypothetical protein
LWSFFQNPLDTFHQTPDNGADILHGLFDQRDSNLGHKNCCFLQVSKENTADITQKSWSQKLLFITSVEWKHCRFYNKNSWLQKTTVFYKYRKKTLPILQQKQLITATFIFTSVEEITANFTYVDVCSCLLCNAQDRYRSKYTRY